MTVQHGRMLTDALVLKTWPYSESTLIVSLLTRDEGVARVLAKGARRIQGQSNAAFDLFSLLRAKMRTRSGEGLGSLSSAELRRSWGYLRTDLKRLALASIGLEILGAVAANSVHEPYFFDEATAFLTGLESSPAPGTFTTLLLVRLLHHAGHPPRLDEALEGAALPDRLAYDFREGSIKETSGTANGVLPLPRSLVERILPAMESPPALDPEFVIPSGDGRLLLRWLIRVWEDHLNQKFPSAQFLEETVLKVGNGK